MKRLIKEIEHRSFLVVLFIVVLMTAAIGFHPSSARADIQVVKHQRVFLIAETFTHQGLTNDSNDDSSISKNDSKNDESSSEDDENDDEDDDWEA